MADVIALTRLDMDTADLELVGGKALGLTRLHAAGLPIPPGVVIPPDHPDVIAAAAEARACLAEPRSYAVRSSAPDEDGFGRSAAGLLPTLLDVPPDQLAAAVSRVRASGGDGSIPVLVMPHLSLQAGGVAFSTDPVHGGDAVVIRVMRGHHAAITDGTTAGEPVCVGPDGTVTADSPHILTDVQARELAAHVRAAAEEIGDSADVEFGVLEDRLVLLQARPITSFPVWEAPPGVWVQSDEYSTAPGSRLFADAAMHIETTTFRETFAQIGMLLETIDFRLIGGYAYSQVVVAGAPPGARGGPPPAPVLGILTRAHPELRRRAAAARSFLLSDGVTALQARTAAHPWDDDRAEAIELARPERLSSDPAEALLRLDEMACRHLRLHFRWVPAVYGQIVGAAGLALEGAGVSHDDALRVVAGPTAAGTATGQNARLLRRAAAALDDQTWAAVDAVAIDDDEGASRLLSSFAGRADAIGTALRELRDAARVQLMGFDLIAPTLLETPAALLAALRQARDTTAPADVDAAAELLALAPPWTHDLLRRAWAEHHQRDRHGIAIGAAMGGLRVAALHVGHGLVAQGLLDSTEQTLSMTVQQLVDAARTHTISEQVAAEVRATDARRLRLGRLQPPRVIGADEVPASGPPDLRFAPRAMRAVNQRMGWTLGALFDRGSGTVETTADGEAHHGVAAAPGIVEGTARIVHDPSQVRTLEKDEVLVCRYTLAMWTSLLQACAGVVTATGGPLSHAAIVARELGIPAVCGLAGALEAIADGDRIRVDGDRGLVTVLHD